MVPLNELTSDSILSDEVLTEVFEQEDEIYKARLLLSLEDRAAELGVKGKFTKLVNAFKRVEKATRQKKKQQNSLVDNWTNFTGEYDNMMCGSWVASDDGIYTFNKDYSNEVIVCYHPILPVERLRNLETGEEQLKLAFKRNHTWREIIVPKDLVSSANKIVALSKLGVAVTSENAKLLVKYLSDVENLNDDHIPVQKSTSKLGWIGSGFMPYDTEIIFDGDTRFKQVFESIKEHGKKDAWYKHMKELRRSGRMEIKFLLAASFASVLLKPLGGLPFFVDLWGETEGGKTVTLMVAASVWANPDESQYIGDFKTTDVALEAKSDMLNNLPMILDDTSKTSARIRDNFEGVVYDLCSGKGKSRSNRELGMNRENRWKNCILTNGERPLNSYVSQGGAINRILEVECGEKVYQDPQKTADIVKKNYGHAGHDFVDIVKRIGVDSIRDIQEDILEELQDDEKMQKQSLSLSIVLTADRIATDFLFNDGQYISINDAREVLVDRNELSDNERCYRYLLDKVAMNPQRFDLDTNVEKWGIIEKGYAIFFNQAFEELCRAGGFSKKSFLSWADRKALIQTQAGRMNKTKKIDGNVYRCIFLKLEEEPAGDGFVDVGQEDLPFK
ncbi:MAG: DUF927 domain-containing protein [Oliverpabstia sp.]